MNIYFTSKQFLSVCAAAGLAFSAESVTAQTMLIDSTTNNGSFETNIDGTAGGKIDPFSQTTSGAAPTTADPVPYWGLTAASAAALTAADTTLDTGIQSGAGLNTDGIWGAFEQPGGAIFNLVTTSPIANAGDLYTLTFDGVDTQGHGGAASSTTTAVSFYTQAAPTTATYGFSGTVVSTTTETLSNAGFVMYTVTYTAAAADVGNDIGIELSDTGADYNGLDNFELTVTPAAVPEPSTYVLLAGGLLGLLFLRGRVRA